MTLHLIKLCVGCDTVEDLVEWHEADRAGQPWIVHTRQTPKRAAELTQGGSLYRVFRGLVLCRQAILAVDTVGEGQAARCHVVLDSQIVLTEPMPRRAFQGWRYLEGKDAPGDLRAFGETGGLPQDLAGKLRELGAW
ncbi:MAG TPA: DUF1489 family protein [Caulobacteraceae bacterium]|nr:DUF1489 family protein [Caulobacteraceae bacterium]